MAKNRTEQKSNFNTTQVATIDIATKYSPHWLDFFDNAKFRKDVIVNQIAGSSPVAIDFTAKDNITLDVTGIAGDATLTLSGLDNGDVKYLTITKSATRDIIFSNATDMTINQNYVKNQTLVVYEIFNKNGAFYARALVDSIPIVSNQTLNITNVVTLASVTSKYSLFGNCLSWSLKFDRGSGNVPANTIIISINDSALYPNKGEYANASKWLGPDPIPLELDASGDLYVRDTLPENRTYSVTFNYQIDL